MKTVKSNLTKNSYYSSAIDKEIAEDNIYIKNCGYGEMALMMALVHPSKQIVALEADHDKLTIARYAADGLVSNLVYVENWESDMKDNYLCYDLSKDI